MNDEEIGQFAKELLGELETRTTYEGRLLTLARCLRQMESIGQAQATAVGTIGDLPGYAAIVAELQAYDAVERPSAASHGSAASASSAILDPDWAPHWTALARGDIGVLIDSAPGPLTAHCRRLAALGAQAHLACQWGQLAEGAPMLWCLGGLLDRLRVLGVGEHDADDPLASLAIFCRMGAVAAERSIPLTATALARRAAGDLGAVARAAARLEGKADLDPNFEALPGDSIRGLDPARAAQCALLVQKALGRVAQKATVPVTSAPPRAATPRRRRPGSPGVTRG
ncbi:MAG: hypothetical protein JWM10_4069 [Myxococcaceae bacterium]|nr:hypothetical protein [Myxococcaceae bacterium]